MAASPDTAGESPALRLGLIGPIPPPNGGMAMQTAQLERLLAESGVAVDMEPTNAAYRPAWIGRVPGLRALARLIPYLWRCWRLAGRCDVIHLMANSGWSWHLFAAPVLLVAPWRGTPVVVNYRGGEARTFFDRSIRWVQPTLRRAARIVVPSAYLEGVFRDFGFTVSIIPNIIDRSVFSPGDSAASGGGGESAESPCFVITRNLEPIYGIDTAIRALAQLREDGITARLEIAGSGPQREELEALCIELGVQADVAFLGRLERPAVVALYHRADAMLNPTTVDNMPNSVIEALACGVPVISSDVGGVPFIVRDGETALLVPVGDVAALAAAMRRVTSEDNLRKHLQERGAELVRAFEWPVVRPQWLGCYAGVAAEAAA